MKKTENRAKDEGRGRDARVGSVDRLGGMWIVVPEINRRTFDALGLVSDDRVVDREQVVSTVQRNMPLSGTW